MAVRYRRVEFANVEAIKQYTMAGLGVTLLPKMAVAEELRNQSLVSVRWVGPEFPVVTQLCWHKEKWMSSALQAFITVVTEILG
ncbi:LysR family transcriptional regulator substrate-binding protein [Alicyclobacillus dauci]|uniref:LysR family transcriptional regulator substrate-binding protein n=1 Tax=Alicyclobacillus dauci TaxID=1475485 RepID=A0ABY6Z3J2_9BACL|nr:LysR family transcriptional regulator substrate-binding protein [Alicyclobacillus dauci]WAH37459.1 LysR family transcriptional regulator substrate-binding protein [Alicyclobacillus dauci]